jgi:hypothetical protein
MHGKEHDAVFKIDVHQGERFLAKVALGLGSLILNDPFRTSRSANLLRDYLWQKDWQKREQMGLYRSGFIGGDRRLTDFLKWPGGHVLTFLKRGHMLLLNAHFFEMQDRGKRRYCVRDFTGAAVLCWSEKVGNFCRL